MMGEAEVSHLSQVKKVVLFSSLTMLDAFGDEFLGQGLNIAPFGSRSRGCLCMTLLD